MTVAPPPAANPPPGWYPDPVTGMLRYWEGSQWTQHTAPPAPPVGYAPRGGYGQPVLQGGDRSQYIRQQHGHSIVAHLLFGWVLLYIPTIYYAISPNHYFHT